MMPMSFNISLRETVSCLGVVPCTGKATNQKGSSAMCVVSESVFYLIYFFFFVQGLLFSKGKIENFLLEERRLEEYVSISMFSR